MDHPDCCREPYYYLPPLLSTLSTSIDQHIPTCLRISEAQKQPIRSQLGLKLGCSDLELGLVVAVPSTSSWAENMFPCFWRLHCRTRRVQVLPPCLGLGRTAWGRERNRPPCPETSLPCLSLWGAAWGREKKKPRCPDAAPSKPITPGGGTNAGLSEFRSQMQKLDFNFAHEKFLSPTNWKWFRGQKIF